MVKGLVKITVFSLILATISSLLREIIGWEHVHYMTYWLILFFWVTHSGIHIFLQFIKDTLDIESHMLMLAAVSARLIIALFGFLIMAMSGVENLITFGINFSVLYLSYLMFEIISVLSNLRPNSSVESNQ